MRLLAVIDEYTQEGLAIRAGRGIRSSDVIHTLAELVVARGAPPHPLDQWPEFAARAVREWLGGWGRDLVHRAWVAVGERIRGELQRQAERQTLEPGGLLQAAEGASADRAVPADLNHIRPYSCLGYQQLAPEGILPAVLVPVLVGLTLQVVKRSGEGHVVGLRFGP